MLLSPCKYRIEQVWLIYEHVQHDPSNLKVGYRLIGWHKLGSVLSFNSSHLKADRYTYLIGPLMSKRGIYFTQPYYIGSKLAGDRTLFWKTVLIWGQPQYLINCKPVYEFKNGAQTSLREALFQNINKFPLFISYFSKKDTVKQENLQSCILACSLFRILHILCQNKRRNSVSLTLNAFVNAQSECGFHLKPI